MAKTSFQQDISLGALGGSITVSTPPGVIEPGAVPPSGFHTNGVVSYDLLKDYDGSDLGYIGASPGWCMAVVRLNQPVSYSRKQKKSIGEVVSGAYQRRSKPLIIFDDCVRLSISRSCHPGQFTKTLNAVLKSSSVNYLSANAVLTGDWIFAWCHNDIENTKKVIKKLLNNKSANDFSDGLKFMGRVHSIRKNLVVNKKSKNVTYMLQAVGFGELDSTFYYDLSMASAVANSGQDLALFMAQIGLDWTKFASEVAQKGGELVDNIDEIVSSFIDIVVGKGGAKIIDDPTGDIYGSVGGKGISKGSLVEGGAQASVGTPRIGKEAPYSYLVPVTAAQIMGKTVLDKSKPSVFGYSDLLHLLIGVQQYDSSTINKPSKGFWPVLEKGLTNRNSANRSFCDERIKGTFIPSTEAVFLNRPLWQILQQFLNQSINQMYTAMKVGPDGKITPTIVVRQIPFSTNCIKEDPHFLLSRFLDMPRWKVSPVMVKELDVGRSDATRKNMIKIIGDASVYGQGLDVQGEGWQTTMHPPIFDITDIARSGIHPHCQVVACSPTDLQRTDGGGFDVWIEAVADWTLGSQNTLNGFIKCIGIQSPIAEGDALEFDDIVYYIESITDTCSISPHGIKSFDTVMTLTNGMPADQSGDKSNDFSEDYPLYPGFTSITFERETGVQETINRGNDTALASNNPGTSEDRNPSLNGEGL
jgi:hypothetical protein